MHTSYLTVELEVCPLYTGWLREVVVKIFPVFAEVTNKLYLLHTHYPPVTQKTENYGLEVYIQICITTISDISTNDY